MARSECLGPLGPLGFDFAQHRQTLRPSVDGVRSKALRPFRSQVLWVRFFPIGAIGALMNRVLQPRPLVALGLNVWMGTAAGADELGSCGLLGRGRYK